MNRLPLGLRSLLRAVVRSPGTLFQPLLIENMPSGREIRSFVRAMAEEEGSRLFTRFSDVSDLGLGERGVALIAAGDLRDGGEAMLVGVPPGCQIIIWSTGGARDLPPEVEQWVARGFRYRPVPGREDGGTPHEACASTLEHCLQKPGRVYNPVTLVVREDASDRTAREVAIRLTAAGLAPVEAVDTALNADHWGVRQAPPAGSGLIVRMDGHDPESEADAGLLYALEQAHSVPVQIVLVVPAETEARLDRVPRWGSFMDRGASVQMSAEPVDRGVSATDLEYPPLRSVMAARPPQAERAQTIVEGAMAQVPLGDTLQFISMSAPNGRLVVFTAHEVAFLDFQGGRIVHAGPADRWVRVMDMAEARGVDIGDSDALRDLAHSVIEDRVVEIADWKEARFAYIGRQVDPPLDEVVSLEPQAIMMTIARREDEWPQIAARVGGLGRIWMRVDTEPPPEDGTLVRRLWDRLDGETALGEAARQLCVSRFDIAEACGTLFAANRITFVRDVAEEARRTEQASGVVLRTLWAEGLTAEAADLASEVAEHYPESAVLAYYRGWVHAERGEWEQGADAFAVVVEHGEGARRDAAAVNRALIAVRHLGQDPEDALAVLREVGVLDRAAGESAATFAPAVVEIATRAYDFETAARLLEHVSSPEVRQRLQAALDRS